MFSSFISIFTARPLNAPETETNKLLTDEIDAVFDTADVDISSDKSDTNPINKTSDDLDDDAYPIGYMTLNYSDINEGIFCSRTSNRPGKRVDGYLDKCSIYYYEVNGLYQVDNCKSHSDLCTYGIKYYTFPLHALQSLHIIHEDKHVPVYVECRIIGDRVQDNRISATNKLRILRIVGRDEIIESYMGKYKHVVNECEEYYWNGNLHRDGDLPAKIMKDEQFYYKYGKLHRDGDLPAIIQPNGAQVWYKNGARHRRNSEDSPAYIHINGNMTWNKNGEYHRDNGLPAIIYSHGDEEWWVNGSRHRDNGLPAVNCINDCKEWWVNGEHIKSNYGPRAILNRNIKWFKSCCNKMLETNICVANHTLK